MERLIPTLSWNDDVHDISRRTLEQFKRNCDLFSASVRQELVYSFILYYIDCCCTVYDEV